MSMPFRHDPPGPAASDQASLVHEPASPPVSPSLPAYGPPEHEPLTGEPAIGDIVDAVCSAVLSCELDLAQFSMSLTTSGRATTMTLHLRGDVTAADARRIMVAMDVRGPVAVER